MSNLYIELQKQAYEIARGIVTRHAPMLIAPDQERMILNIREALITAARVQFEYGRIAGRDEYGASRAGERQ